MRPSLVLGVALAMSLAVLSSSASPASPGASVSSRGMSAAEIASALDRLAVVGSVLYVAAHPDDENTRLLAWLVGEKKLKAGYLSLTRGDGGQNLIGAEQDELLGLIRTHELLAARGIDGAEQLFTRARDFGYSKSAAETLAVWGREEVLADVVLAIRRFRPDVIVTRFTAEPPNHGHHMASAVLAEEAFVAAADKKRFPAQLPLAPAFQAQRLLHNVSTWRLAPDADMSRYLQLDVGGYDALSGRSWGEVAAESRSQHRSQGFGAMAERGPALEYFAPLAGRRPTGEPFEGLDFSWRRFPGTERLIAAIEDARAGFDLRAPHKSMPALRRVHAALSSLPVDNPWRARKLRELEDVIVACAGLFVDARASAPTAAPGGALAVSLQALNRSPVDVKLLRVALPGASSVKLGRALEHHSPLRLERTAKLPRDTPISTPYWLRSERQGGLYAVDDPALIGLPEGPWPLTVTFELDVGGLPVSLTRPIVHVRADPVRGEQARAVEVAPVVTLELDRDVVLVPNRAPQEVRVTVEAGVDDVQGTVKIALPRGWRASPAKQPFRLKQSGQRQTFAFQVAPPKGASAEGVLRAVADVGGRRSSWKARTTSHEHVPPLTVREPAIARLVPLELVIGPKRIGYIPGAGDKVAESLAAVGYEVSVLSDEDLAKSSLDGFDAIVLGVRAYNANPRLVTHRDRLLRYVEAGGRLIVQYNTNNRMRTLDVEVGPYPLEIGRERVTDETAAVTPVRADEPLLSKPNALTEADFQGWVQERGLYFATRWDARYRPVFRMHDEGEPPLEGALLLARHGKGTFVYTGLSFFRQLPAGVPGAYRLMANLLAQ